MYGAGTKTKRSRAYTEKDKTTINIREMFVNSIPCHICGGAINLQQGLQYDHTQDFAVYRVTDPETGKPTHPFCNNFKKIILDGRKGKSTILLPELNIQPIAEENVEIPVKQLSYWGDSEFPDS